MFNFSQWIYMDLWVLMSPTYMPHSSSCPLKACDVSVKETECVVVVIEVVLVVLLHLFSPPVVMMVVDVVAFCLCLSCWSTVSHQGALWALIRSANSEPPQRTQRAHVFTGGPEALPWRHAKAAKNTNTPDSAISNIAGFKTKNKRSSSVFFLLIPSFY